MPTPITKYAALNALGTAAYISLVASLLFYAQELFGNENVNDTVLIPIAMLLLFVLSASITGGLVLGRPILWYLEGRKKDAISLLVTTIGILSVITFFAFLCLSIAGRS